MGQEQKTRSCDALHQTTGCGGGVGQHVFNRSPRVHGVLPLRTGWAPAGTPM